MKAKLELLKIFQEAATPFVWIDSNEFHRVIDVIIELRLNKIFLWDPFSGCRCINQQNHDEPPTDIESSMTSPIQAVDFYCSQDDDPFSTVMCMINVGPFVENPTFQTAIINSYDYMAASGKTIFMIGPLDKDLPSTIEPYVVITTLPLPGIEDIKNAMTKYIEVNQIHKTLFRDIDAVAHAAKGMTITELLTAVQFLFTRTEAHLTKRYADEGDVAKRLVITPEMMTAYKTSLVSNRFSGVRIYKPTKTDKFDYIIGLNNVKHFMQTMATSNTGKGTLLLGVPGNAKSMLAKALGYEIGWSIIKLDLTSMFHHLVGSSENRIRTALANIESLSPCVVWIDEIEKALSVPEAGNDGGVTSKIVSVILQWLDEPHENVYVVATSNNVLKLPPELVRSERWDSMFFVDYPTPEARKAIWKLWMSHYGINEHMPTPADDKWSGADIKACCRLAQALKTTPAKAAQFVVPVSRMFDTSIQALRDWAATRTVLASWDVDVDDTVKKSTSNVVTLPSINNLVKN